MNKNFDDEQELILNNIHLYKNFDADEQELMLNNIHLYTRILENVIF